MVFLVRTIHQGRNGINVRYKYKPFGPRQYFAGVLEADDDDEENATVDSQDMSALPIKPNLTALGDQPRLEPNVNYDMPPPPLDDHGMK